MDISLLAEQAVELLKPYLGVLVTAGAGALGKDVWVGIKDIWKKLEPMMKTNQELKTAAQDVAAKPDDPDNVAALTAAIRKLLQDDSALANEIQLPVLRIMSGRDTYIDNVISDSDNAQIGPR